MYLIVPALFGVVAKESLSLELIEIRRRAALAVGRGRVFIDPDARYERHLGIERAAAGLNEKFPTFKFAERGDVQSYNGIGRLPWGYGPAGAEAVITGIDVLVMKGDKIGAVYTFLDSRKK